MYDYNSRILSSRNAQQLVLFWLHFQNMNWSLRISITEVFKFDILTSGATCVLMASMTMTPWSYAASSTSKEDLPIINTNSGDCIFLNNRTFLYCLLIYHLQLLFTIAVYLGLRKYLINVWTSLGKFFPGMCASTDISNQPLRLQVRTPLALKLLVFVRTLIGHIVSTCLKKPSPLGAH